MCDWMKSLVRHNTLAPHHVMFGTLSKRSPMFSREQVREERSLKDAPPQQEGTAWEMAGS